MEIDPIFLIMGGVFFGAAALVVFLLTTFIDQRDSELEARLTAFTGRNKKSGPLVANEILRDGLSTAQGIIGRILQRFEKLPMFFRQADSPIGMEPFILLCGGLSLAVAALYLTTPLPRGMMPLAAGFGFLCPWIWLQWRRRKRITAFEKQLPDALELLARALRSGNSLAAGFSIVASEMPIPISSEFRTVYDEQNLGLPLDQALKGMLVRMPNMDLQFFVTAVTIQKQAGGDLAEILGKISSLVRERFKILGQVKALTGEGRLSGVVLMALPVVLFGVVYVTNNSYAMMLLDRELGRKMLAMAVVAQILGGYVIKRIVDIKV